MDRSECAMRMSVILKAEGPDLVFTLPEICSRSALVARLPEATAAEADVEVVRNVLRDTPDFSLNIAISLKLDGLLNLLSQP